MDTIELPLELRKAIEEADKKNERAIGYGASPMSPYSAISNRPRVSLPKRTRPPETRTTSISRPMRRTLPFLLLGTFIVSAEVYPFFGMQCAGTRLTTAI